MEIGCVFLFFFLFLFFWGKLDGEGLLGGWTGGKGERGKGGRLVSFLLSYFPRAYGC